jgi:hypothetical protein
MSHSQTIQTRRRKQRARKDLVVAAKQAKRLKKQNAKKPRAS